MIPFERLVDWALGEQEDEALELHLLSCDDCAQAANRLFALRERVPEVVRVGRVGLVLTPSLVARIAAEGLTVRWYDVAPGESIACSADPGQVYGITRLSADLTGVVRAAVRVEMQGATVKVWDDVPFDAPANAVFLADPGEVLRALPTTVVTLQLTGTDASGAERTLGRYELRHTASRAG